MKYMLSLFAEEGGWDDVTPEQMGRAVVPHAASCGELN